MASAPDGQQQGADGHLPGPSLPPVLQAVEYWLRCIEAWYPKRRTKTYFLPIFFRRQQFGVINIGNQSVLVHEPPSKKAKVDMYPSGPSQPPTAQPQPVQVAGKVWTLPQGPPAPLPQFQQTDFIDDDTAERLLTCLRVIGDKNKEGMVVISQLEFRKYLDNKTDPLEMLSKEEADKMKKATDAACASLPRADTLGPKHRDGDFDVLVVHSEVGLLVMEVNATNIPDLSTKLRVRMRMVLTQLHKYSIVLRHMTSDMPAPINVIKVLVLPYVTEDQLRQALEDDRLDPGRQRKGDKPLEEELCDQLGSDDLSVALSRCLLADRMPTMEQLGLLAVDTADPAGKAEAERMVDKLQDWWRGVTVCSNEPLSEDNYDQLLARFCGPVTSVKIPTVTVTKEVTLYPEQKCQVKHGD